MINETDNARARELIDCHELHATRELGVPALFLRKDHADTARLLGALLAEREAIWKTGIPPVPTGKRRRFWCAVKHGQVDKIGHCILEYANSHVMPLSDSCCDVPEDAIPVGDDGDYSWTGWHQEACDSCDTWWQFTGTVLAWTELPRTELAALTAHKGK